MIDAPSQRTTFKKGKYVLIHDRGLDDWGFERDFFDIFDTELRVHRPFMAPPKVGDKGLDFHINKVPYDYTNEDYEKMLDEQVARINI